MTDRLGAGASGIGTIAVTNGGAFTFAGTSMNVAAATSAVGNPSVTGGSFAANNVGSLFVGNGTGAVGTVTLGAGGSLSDAGGTLVLGQFSGASGATNTATGVLNMSSSSVLTVAGLRPGGANAVGNKPDTAADSYRISGRHNQANPKQALTNILFVDGHASSVLRASPPQNASTDFTRLALAAKFAHPLWRIDQP